MTKVSNCGGDERRQARGGQAGDQTGTEWYVREWYDFGQDVVLRHSDPNVRQMIATMATECAANNNIGYDQGERYTFWEQLVRAGYLPANITSACETDCSAGTCAIVQAVGHRLGRDKLKAVPYWLWTGNMVEHLRKAGFVTLTDGKYLRSGDYLLAGDINLNQVTHVNVCVTNGPKSGESGQQDTQTSTSGPLDVDGQIGPLTVSEWQRQCGTTVDGVVSGQMHDCRASFPALTSVTYEEDGSELMRRVQALLGVPSPTGIIFRGTVSHLQGLLHLWGYDCSADRAGILDVATAKAIQQSLNEGRWEDAIRQQP